MPLAAARVARTSCPERRARRPAARDRASSTGVPRVRSRPSPRVVLGLLAFVALIAGLALVLRPGTSPAADADPAPKRFADGSCAEDPVRFGLALAPGDLGGVAAARRFADELTERLGCRTLVVPRASQGELVTALSTHEVDIAQVDPAVVIVAERVVGSSVVGAYTTDGDTPARSTPPAIWVREASRLRTLGDLRGRAVALGPQLTAGGDLDPRDALLRAGVPKGGVDDRTTRWSADDAEALAALRSRDVDAAVTRGVPPGGPPAGLRAVWAGDAPLADVMLARPAIPNAVRRLLLNAVRRMPAASLGPLSARQGLRDAAPLATVPLGLYAPLADRFDRLAGADLLP